MKHADTSKKRFDSATMEAAIAAAPKVAVPDDDCPPLNPSDWDGAIVSSSLQDLREQIALRRTRGPGKKPARVAIQLRLQPDVLARWKASGPGWQTRMAEWLAAHTP